MVKLLNMYCILYLYISTSTLVLYEVHNRLHQFIQILKIYLIIVQQL